MKLLSLLPLVALAFAADDTLDAAGATSEDFAHTALPNTTAGVFPFACNISNALITNQLAEIQHLQERSIPVTHDLTGYFYAIVKGRKILGCPHPNPLDASSASSAGNVAKRASPLEQEVFEDLCKPARQLKDEVMEQIGVLQEYHMPIPDFLAGWYSLTKDADKYLNCGLQNSTTALQNSTIQSEVAQ